MSSVRRDGKQPLQGKAYWRSLDQLADKPEFREWLHREFPQGASEMDNSWSRRSFLTLMGASVALAGLAGCRRPEEKIVPYVKAPEEIVPGIPRQYATTMPAGNSAYGVVVESHEGRPGKIEGNKLHPSSQGHTSARVQASILDLYDPDRSQYVLQDGSRKEWSDFVAFWSEQYAELQENDGAGLAVLSEPFSSPTLSRLEAAFQKRFRNARWVTWEPINNESLYEGIRIATGQRYQPVYKYEDAEVVLSLDCDFLLTEDESVAHTAGFSAGRKVTQPGDRMNRLYVVEALLSLTGANADHRLRLKSSQVGEFALALAGELKKNGVELDAINGVDIPLAPSQSQKWISALAKDLIRTRGNNLIVAGRRQPTEVHALTAALNEALGNIGNTIKYVEQPDTHRSDLVALRKLSEAMQRGEITTLVMLGGNPVYNAPSDFAFSQALKHVDNKIHVNSHVDETSAEVTWHIPRAHYLERWGDARSVDGTLSVVQPLIAPLFDAHDDIELTGLLATGKEMKAYDQVRETWRQYLSGDFEKQWRRVLHDGVLEESSVMATSPAVKAANVASVLRQFVSSGAPSDDRLELVLHPCTKVGEGTQSNNGWLQELPDPITKLSWDNVATLGPATAKMLGVENEDVVRVAHEGTEIDVPVWIVPGQADNTVGVALGYGRTRAGRVGKGVGVNGYPLRRSTSQHVLTGVRISKAGRKHLLANTQDHGSMEGRPIVREATLTEYEKHPEFAREMVEHPALESLWEEPSYKKGYQWGMTIDLNACTGCNACVVACQSENNIPVVGQEQVRNGREMHWIRIDRYFTGMKEDPEVVLQPVTCQHCENAPCEQVCPVAATLHDDEGLNVMVYNRCIGTRYCSNNCPYKVRRFNFFNYTEDYPETVQMAQNPDVTVRSRGVMEKCTFCLQRINAAKKSAKKDDRELGDGEVVTACQQVCPADAIVFGDVNDKGSQVSKMKERDRRYDLLAELNTQPRLSYLAKLRNPNPELT